MSESALFIVGMLVFAVAIASSVIGTIGTSGETMDLTEPKSGKSIDSLPPVPE